MHFLESQKIPLNIEALDIHPNQRNYHTVKNRCLKPSYKVEVNLESRFLTSKLKIEYGALLVELSQHVTVEKGNLSSRLCPSLPIQSICWKHKKQKRVTGPFMIRKMTLKPGHINVLEYLDKDSRHWLWPLVVLPEHTPPIKALWKTQWTQALTAFGE